MVHGDRDNIGRGLNISTIMTSWMIQPMYPIIRCIRAGIDGRIELSQSSLPVKDATFAQELLNVTDNNHFTWWIPISITDARRPDFEGNGPRLWLTPDRLRIVVPYFPTSVDAEKHWIIINSQMSTYARVLYDDANWQLIARQLLANHTVIPRVTRAQLIDDAFSLASMGLLDYGVVMDVVEYTTVVQDDFVASTLLYYIHILMADHKEKNQTLYSLIEVTTSTIEMPPLNYLTRLFFCEARITLTDCLSVPIKSNHSSCRADLKSTRKLILDVKTGPTVSA